MDCIFCKLAGGVFPTAKVYEDDELVAFLDVSPASKGHTLIVPKAHYADLTELPDELAARILPLAKRIGQRMLEVLPIDGFHLVQNNGEAAGQTVFHFHLHVIPRVKGDGPMVSWTPGYLLEEDKEQLVAALRLEE
ncbi:MAG: HIT family protein [Lachnospiraceae bacterium]|nr:HIT family protein [Lachnospiraceae bacterium]MDY5742338.1 HIT family protein [Lachnospiraceae bacterium]